jgi:hypothetical protein
MEIYIAVMLVIIYAGIVGFVEKKNRSRSEKQSRRWEQERKQDERYRTFLEKRDKNKYKTHQYQPEKTANYIPSSLSSTDTERISTYPPRRTVTYTQRNNLTSWALHKQPGDIQPSDYMIPPSGDIVIHREGGVVKIVKGPGAGRVLSEWELDDYIDSL